MAGSLDAQQLQSLRSRLDEHARALGFDQVGIAGIELPADEANLERWLGEERHGGMDYMARHGQRRSRPGELVPGTLRVISVRMASSAPDAAPPERVLADGRKGYVARYALGRDYHKILRSRLRTLAERLAAEFGPFGYRAFVDSAPVMEKPLARNAGLGWIGKHTNLINERAGSLLHAGRIVHRPAAAGGSACEGPLRQLQRLHTGLSDRRDHGAVPARRAPLHFLSDDRAPRRHT